MTILSFELIRIPPPYGQHLKPLLPCTNTSVILCCCVFSPPRLPFRFDTSASSSTPGDQLLPPCQADEMADQSTNYLPPALSKESVEQLLHSLNLPKPRQIEALQVSAAFHSIYLLHFSAADGAAHLFPGKPEADGSIALVLRVSGTHLPRIKTLNEMGVLEWVRKETSIPVPAVVGFDAGRDNVLGCEYALLERVGGVSVDGIYERLTWEERRGFVEQLVGFLVQLHSRPWEGGYVGSLSPGRNGKEVGRGPPMEETFCLVPDVEKYWAGTGETVETLNPLDQGGYPSWTAYVAGCVERYIHAIMVHDSLAGYRDLVPRLQKFIEAVKTPKYQEQIDSVQYVLAHKDLHFGNIMCDPATLRVTGILDWEFASVVPAPRWNPVRAFLWNGRQDDEHAMEEKGKMMDIFEEICRQRKVEWMLEQVAMNQTQDDVMRVVNYVRAIVEVCPRGQRGDKAMAWKEVVEGGLARFEV